MERSSTARPSEPLERRGRVVPEGRIGSPQPELGPESIPFDGRPPKHRDPGDPDADPLRPKQRVRRDRVPGGIRGRGRFDAAPAAHHEDALVPPAPPAAGTAILLLDRRSARLLIADGAGGWSARRFRGLAEGRPRSTGHDGSGPPGMPGGSPEHHRRGYEAALLQRYHDRIIAALAGCIDLVIAGPGPGKFEFRHRLEHHPEIAQRLRGVLGVERRIGDAELVRRCLGERDGGE